ncbi:hypothetical protein AB0F24_26965 [Streptomyces platensis]|uniref:hypothetical protein n=1 Tax=Streptomyces platensis TaxID=58346 RepID=UPI0033F53A29
MPCPNSPPPVQGTQLLRFRSRPDGPSELLRVPRRTLTATAFAVSAFLLLYTVWAAAQTINDFNGDGVFSPWIVVSGESED